MTRHLVIVFAAVALLTLWVDSLTVTAHDIGGAQISWNREISRIFTARCISCHHDGGSAFSLTTYKEAFAWKTAIRDEVLQRDGHRRLQRPSQS